MIRVSAPIGNIFADGGFERLKDENFERLKVSRTELGKKVLRRQTDRGTDIGLSLDPGVILRNGDVLRDGESPIVVEQLPEKAIVVRLKTSSNMETMVLLGHIIGNMHRPISIQRDEIVFPIQVNSERTVFEKLFHGIINHIEMAVEDRVFFPHSGADVHGH